LAYHLRQHLFFHSENVVVASRGLCRGRRIDHHFFVTYILMGFVFVAAQFRFGYLVWKYREGKSSAKADYSHGNMTLELSGRVLTTVLFNGLNLASSSIWASERFRPAGENAVHVEVTGIAVRVVFPLPGADGKFGLTKPELEDASAGGEAALGLDTNDPASKDDVVTGVWSCRVEPRGRSYFGARTM